ncbi:MAG: hypothetical protein RI885_398 [Actinomycetota bacterium]
MSTRAVSAPPSRETQPTRASGDALPPAPLWIAVFLAVVGGVTLAGAFPQLGWWPLVFVGTPLVLYSLVGRTFWSSLLVGLLAGFAFWGTHISWLTVYLGAVPWLALAGLQSVFFAIGAAVIAFAWRFADRVQASSGQVRRAGVLRLGVVPLVVAALWTLREFVTTTWPYGGFSWGRLSFSQSESPFGDLVAWVGVSGLSFLLAWVCALIVQVARSAPWRRRGIRSIVGAVLTPVVLLLALLTVPAFPIVVDDTATIGAVQGDSDAGLFSSYERGEILRDHLAATEPLIGEDIDLLVWPENASDLDPLEFRQAQIALDDVTDEVGAPLVVGAVTAEGDDIFNSVLLWRSGEGSVDQYDKIHPVPFAEYIPDRDFWYPLAPDLLSLIPRDYTVGTRDNVFDIEGTDIRAGIAICFDIVDDSLIRRMVADDANIIVAPTNNADFGPSDESVQQLAIARLRAIETGRSVVNASTVGTSAIIGPDGGTLERLPTFEPGTMLQKVPLSTTTTASTVIGQGLEITLSLLGLVGVVALGVAALRGRQGPVDESTRRARDDRG